MRASGVGTAIYFHNTIYASRLRLLFIQHQDMISNDFRHIPLTALLVIVRLCLPPKPDSKI